MWDEGQWKCKHCGAEFLTGNGLTIHVKNAHFGETMNDDNQINKIRKAIQKEREASEVFWNRVGEEQNARDRRLEASVELGVARSDLDELLK